MKSAQLSSDVNQNNNCPWIEKYRPKTANDVHQQYEVVAALKHCIQMNVLPNLLFHGPPGTGKTSLILAAAKELFKDEFSERVLELNASDERGIQVVREKIKKFSQYFVSNVSMKSRESAVPTFKLIILDEVDNMTHAAQSALRRIMETESSNTRFCLICNYLSKIISPIISRCSKFRFDPLLPKTMISFLFKILDAENLNFDNKKDLLDKICSESGGDMRKAVNILQNVSHILKIQSTDGSPIDINDFIGILPDKVKKQCIDAVFKPKYDPEQFIDEYIKSGYSFETILRCLIDEIVYIQTYNVSENVKIKSLRLIAEYEYKVTTGADSELALKSLILSLRNLNE